MQSENAALEILLDRLSRVEVIDETGRAYGRRGIEVGVSLQDDGRTLKLFVTAAQPDRRFFRLSLGRAGAHE